MRELHGAPPLVVLTPGGDMRELLDYTLDLNLGGTDDFVLETTERLQPGSLIWIDATEYGGRVDTEGTDTETGYYTYKGPVFRAMLEGYITQSTATTPTITKLSPWHDAFTAAGELGYRAQWVEPSGPPLGTSGTIPDTPRFYTLRALLEWLVHPYGYMYTCMVDTEALKPQLTVRAPRTVEVDAADIAVKRTMNANPVTYLVGAGQGEGDEREVVRYRWDGLKAVETDNPPTVTDHAAVYELTAKAGQELKTATAKKLNELHADDSAEITYHGPTEGLHIGDRVHTQDDVHHIDVTATITEITVTVDDMQMTTTVKCGGPNTIY